MERKWFILTLLGALLNSAGLSQNVHLPLEHWAYDALDRWSTMGLIRDHTPLSGPLTREEIATRIASMDTVVHADRSRLCPADFALFEQLKGELHDALDELNVKTADRYRERHLFRWREKENAAFIDLHFEQDLDFKTGDSDVKGEAVSQTTLGGIVRGRLHRNLEFYAFAKNTLSKGDAITEEHFDPGYGTPVTISGTNVYRDDAAASLVWSLPWLRLAFGRDQAAWGPGYRGSLMLSRHARYFDMLQMNVTFRRFRFLSIHGKLSSGVGQKYLAGHRLEVQILRWLQMSWSETVIYGNRGIEPMYINPLMPYHVAEHHLGDRDNNCMGFDCVAYPARNLKMVMEFFLDDFTMAKNPFTYFGNKWAILAGLRWTAPFRLRNVDVVMEYARIEPFVYTHRDSINTYTNYDRSIGHWLGPNSDDLFIRTNMILHRDLHMAFTLERIRRGEGGLLEPHDRSEGDRKAFLAGTVEKIWNVGFSFRWQVFRDAFLSLDYRYADTHNALREPGADSQVHHCKIHLFINY